MALIPTWKGAVVSRSVKTTYKKAGSTPSSRQKAAQSVTEGIPRVRTSPLSPLTRYITENEGTGISTSELIEQFRELDCDHATRHVISESNTKKTIACISCGQMETIFKAGK